MALGQQLYNYIFPPRVSLSSKDYQLLAQMYPNVDWTYVWCHNNLPWFMHYTFAIGTALPHFYSRKKLHIYLRDAQAMPSSQRLSILVHEAFHIQQYHDLNSMGRQTSGLGFNRRFMRYYLGWYFQGLYQAFFQDKKTWKASVQHAYRQHPMEIPAYQQEEKFRNYYCLHPKHLATELTKQAPHLVCQQAPIPTAPAFPFHSLATLLTLVLSIAKPLIDSLIAPIAFLLGGRQKKS